MFYGEISMYSKEKRSTAAKLGWKKRDRKVSDETRKKMREVHLSGSIDYAAREKKRVSTVKKNGSKQGRPPGPRPKRGIVKPCPVCGNLVYNHPKDLRENVVRHCSRKCLNLNPEHLSRLRNVDKSYMQTEEYRNTLRKDTTPAYKRYRNLVNRLSEKTYAEFIDEINPNRYPRTLCGVDGGWQLDHIKTVKDCFDQGVDPTIVANKTNLRMLPWKTNLLRGNS